MSILLVVLGTEWARVIVLVILGNALTNLMEMLGTYNHAADPEDYEARARKKIAKLGGEKRIL